MYLKVCVKLVRPRYSATGVDCIEVNAGNHIKFQVELVTLRWGNKQISRTICTNSRQFVYYCATSLHCSLFHKKELLGC